MKKSFLWMLATILLCGLTMMSCAANDDNAVVPEEPQYPANFDVFPTLPGNSRKTSMPS